MRTSPWCSSLGAPRSQLGRINALLAGAIFVAVIAVAVVAGLKPRLDARAELRKDAEDLNIPTVSVIVPKASAAAQELVLPGTIQPFLETPVYARTSGYLKAWHADIGTRVKLGEVLAEIDTPEVDAQLLQARADLATAEATHRLARITADRYAALLPSEAVSRQEADEKHGDVEVRKANLDAARFNVVRLAKLQSFKQVRAPFAGVVTGRNTDVGALIDAGAAGGSGKELFHLASTGRVRVFVNVPQSYSREAVPGVEAELGLAEFPGRRFKGLLARTSKSIDAASHTLLTELEVDNPDGELLPGAYAEVHLKIKASHRGLVVPVNTLLFRAEGTQVAVLRGEQAFLVPVVIATDYGTEVALSSGLKGDEQVILNPADSLLSGARVRLVKTPPPATGKAGPG